MLFLGLENLTSGGAREICVCSESNYSCMKTMNLQSLVLMSKKIKLRYPHTFFLFLFFHLLFPEPLGREPIGRRERNLCVLRKKLCMP